jgi:hypothetical protein
MANMGNVTLKTTTHDGKRFGAGGCTVWFGNIPVEGVALLAGDEKWVTTREHAYTWLEEHGCPADLAARLVNDATRDQG